MRSERMCMCFCFFFRFPLHVAEDLIIHHKCSVMNNDAPHMCRCGDNVYVSSSSPSQTVHRNLRNQQIRHRCPYISFIFISFFLHLFIYTRVLVWNVLMFSCSNPTDFYILEMKWIKQKTERHTNAREAAAAAVNTNTEQKKKKRMIPCGTGIPNWTL